MLMIERIICSYFNAVHVVFDAMLSHKFVMRVWEPDTCFTVKCIVLCEQLYLCMRTRPATTLTQERDC